MSSSELKDIQQEFEDLKSKLREPIQKARSQRYKNILQLQDLDKRVADIIHVSKHLPSQFKTALQRKVTIFQSASPDAKPASLEVIVQFLRNKQPWEEEPNLQQHWYQWSNQPLNTLKGIGSVRQKQFEAEGFKTIGDLLLYLPRNYVFWEPHENFANIKQGDHVVTQGEVIHTGQRFGRGRQRRFEVTIQDSGFRKLHLVFFHFQKGAMEDRFRPGQWITVCGEAFLYRQKLQMTHPKSAPGMVPHKFEGVMPIYPERGTLKRDSLAKVIQTALSALPETLKDPLPSHLLEHFNFPSFISALKQLHQPHATSPDELSKLEGPRERLIFTELLCAQIGLAKIQQKRAVQPGPTIQQIAPGLIAQERFSFELTNAQTGALNDILQDMSETSPMGRLLQGDVGSGKTAVAIGACDAVLRQGLQCALMAPTEILAEQHYMSFKNAFTSDDEKIGLLTASTKTAARRIILENILTGRTQVLIGTHSLLNPKVVFNNLGLTIVDEQHRFGVSQRAQLRIKGIKSQNVVMPHFLAMTATPIPRSLALTLYGDLELSVLDEMPPGRLPVATTIISQDFEEKLQAELTAICHRNERAYVVYPLIEESEKIDLNNAMAGYSKLREIFPNKVGLLHGRLSGVEKDNTINSFKAGDFQILVSTTVVEVGVDVPEATLMVIMNAERFGLSQLHQLRGRVGRSPRPSRCILIPGDGQTSLKAQQRLAVLAESNDGFLIAAQDLQIRGPGDFLGTRQAGLPSFAFADPIRDAKILNQARKWAKVIIQMDPTLEADEHQDLAFLMKRLNLEGINYTEAG